MRGPAVNRSRCRLVLVVAAIDRRVKAVVSQVPLVSGHANLRAPVRADFGAGFREMFDADPLGWSAGRPPWCRSSTRTRSPHPRCPRRSSWQWFTETGQSRPPPPPPPPLPPSWPPPPPSPAAAQTGGAAAGGPRAPATS